MARGEAGSTPVRRAERGIPFCRTQSFSVNVFAGMRKGVYREEWGNFGKGVRGKTEDLGERRGEGVPELGYRNW